MENKGFSTETAFRTLELINSWINNVDTKVSFALAFSTTILGLIFYNAGSEPKALQEFKIAYAEKSISFLNWCSVVMLFLMYISFLIVLICFFLSLRGRVVNSNKRKSVFFFGTIANYSMNDYKSKIFSMNEQEIEKDLAEQIYINSQICINKFEWYNRGFAILIVSAILCVLCLSFRIL
jgi:hypothetical protein